MLVERDLELERAIGDRVGPEPGERVHVVEATDGHLVVERERQDGAGAVDGKATRLRRGRGGAGDERRDGLGGHEELLTKGSTVRHWVLLNPGPPRAAGRRLPGERLHARDGA